MVFHTTQPDYAEVKIARLRELPQVLDRALGYCLELTDSEFGFIGSLTRTLVSLTPTTR